MYFTTIDTMATTKNECSIGDDMWGNIIFTDAVVPKANTQTFVYQPPHYEYIRNIWGRPRGSTLFVGKTGRGPFQRCIINTYSHTAYIYTCIMHTRVHTHKSPVESWSCATYSRDNPVVFHSPIVYIFPLSQHTYNI